MGLVSWLGTVRETKSLGNEISALFNEQLANLNDLVIE
jgi:hypothetical protein